MTTGVALMWTGLSPKGNTMLTQTKKAKWQAGVETAVCFIHGCDYDDIDPRGPVNLRGDDTNHYACAEHWEAIMRVLGQQVGSDDEHRPSAFVSGERPTNG